MSSDIVLSSTIQSNLRSLQSQTSDKTNEASNTRKSPAESAQNQRGEATSTLTLSSGNSASTLSRALDGISDSLKTIENTNSAISAITERLNSELETIKDALNPETDTQTSANLQGLRTDIDAAAEKASYRGTNLLKGDTLVTHTDNDERNAITTKGIDATSEGLGLGALSIENGDDLENALKSLENAAQYLDEYGSSLAQDMENIQNRRNFTEQTIATLGGNIEGLNIKDQSEEGARLLVLQMRQMLESSSSSLASGSQQNTLRLF
ncbi:MAG: hypothetical protein CMH26_01255 [Micavibrio sp.]|nr:hypothetical protein [Micavibrio sp.]|tara:strand:+ start:622 stop:1422 length:801 start_codon:yes stop_codon:yes gene_type:complete